MSHKFNPSIGVKDQPTLSFAFSNDSLQERKHVINCTALTQRQSLNPSSVAVTSFIFVSAKQVGSTAFTLNSLQYCQVFLGFVYFGIFRLLVRLRCPFYRGKLAARRKNLLAFLELFLSILLVCATHNRQAEGFRFGQHFF